MVHSGLGLGFTYPWHIHICIHTHFHLVRPLSRLHFRFSILTYTSIYWIMFTCSLRFTSNACLSHCPVAPAPLGKHFLSDLWLCPLPDLIRLYRSRGHGNNFPHRQSGFIDIHVDTYSCISLLYKWSYCSLQYKSNETSLIKSDLQVTNTGQII